VGVEPTTVGLKARSGGIFGTDQAVESGQLTPVDARVFAQAIIAVAQTGTDIPVDLWHGLVARVLERAPADVRLAFEIQMGAPNAARKLIELASLVLRGSAEAADRSARDA